MTVTYDRDKVPAWEEAWRSANSPDKVVFLSTQARQRGEEIESSLGLLRSTYLDPASPVEGDPTVDPSGVDDADGSPSTSDFGEMLRS